MTAKQAAASGWGYGTGGSESLYRLAMLWTLAVGWEIIHPPPDISGWETIA
jgi:hypothetical protein